MRAEISLIIRLAMVLLKLTAALPSSFINSRIAASKYSAVSLALVSTAASYSDKPYSRSKRAFIASGSSGIVAFTAALSASEMTNGNKSGSGK